MGWLVAETRTEYGTISTDSLEKRYSKKGGGGHPPAAVANSEIPQGSLIYDFSSSSLEITDTLYQKDVDILSPPKRTMTKNFDF